MNVQVSHVRMEDPVRIMSTSSLVSASLVGQVPRANQVREIFQIITSFYFKSQLDVEVVGLKVDDTTNGRSPRKD